MGGRRIDGRQLIEGVIQGEDVLGGLGGGDGGFVQILAPAWPPRLAALRRGLLHQDSPHGLGRRREEVAAAVPLLGLIGVHQTDISLMHQGRGLKRLAGLLLGQLLAANLRSSS